MKFSFERLEDRRLLATDMGEITGLVLNDLQNDSNAANDVAVENVSVGLFLDDGDLAFDSGDQQVQTTMMTDANGRYTFTGLEAGKYFVQITPPVDLQVLPGGDVVEVDISAAQAMGVTGDPIDGFTTNQDASASPPLPSSDPDALDDAAVLGGERDLFVELTGGTDVLTSVDLQTGGGLLRLSSDSGVTGNATIVYDGNDDDATTIDFEGLGVDLTTSGGNTMTGVSLTIGADQPNAQITLRFYSNQNDFSEFLVDVPQTSGGLATEEVVVNFADTPDTIGGGGADFANIGAIELTFAGVTAVDGQIALIGLLGNTTLSADFTVLNRMSLGDLVFADIDNNGLFDNGELGIDGVTLTLFEDSDDSGDFTPGVDQATGDTATTSGGGFYLFENLLPGDYLVQVDQSNFDTGVLLGLSSSTGNDISGMAPDPDDPADGAANLNNDDNGTPLTGAGVVSKAITLVGNDEPTDDGDATPNDDSNLTVDFGFVGFDLVIDKMVSSETTAPGGTLTYTIAVTNNGPSMASSVTFTDNLPSDVTFTSGSKDVGDLAVQHAAGVVTADLGDLAPGATATVIILVGVNNDATTTLVNNASVSAPNESNTDNNDDQVQTTVNPQIDLVLTKSDNDNDQQIAPGDTIVYTVTVTNSGPSMATNVIVTDTLPGDVTFDAAGATPAPSDINGDVLTYNLGDIDAGDSRTITIGVTVDTDFVGTLTNTAVVDANEDETNENNNTGMAQSLVAVELSSIAGNVYVDRDNDGVFDANEIPLGGITVTLTGIDFTGGMISQTVVTQSDGSYLFSGLLPGTYRVQETQNTFFGDGMDTIGSAGGDVADDDFSQIVLASGVDATAYNFGELAPTLTKRRFLASSAVANGDA